jgi:plasmid maintenance system antidote protein VapI
MTTNKMRPIHPGEILREELDEIRLSARSLAAALKVPANRITAILMSAAELPRTPLSGWRAFSGPVRSFG